MKPWLPAAIFMATLTLAGCAGFGPGAWWQAEQAAPLAERARDLEARGELQMALAQWRLVKTAQAPKEIQRLEDKIAAAVKARYQQGLRAIQRRQPKAARNHFLAVLRLDPTFRPALKQVMARFSPFPFRVYQTTPGDRPASIAKKLFGDADKAFVVAWFNQVPDDQVLEPGILLLLPNLKKSKTVKPVQQLPPGPLTEARTLLAEGNLEGALSLAVKANPADPKVQGLIHTIHIQQAMEQIEAGMLDDATQILASVPDPFPAKANASQALAVARKQRQFDTDLSRAQESFDLGRYTESLTRTKALLQVAPKNEVLLILADEARFRLAMDHFDHKRFQQSRAMLDRMTPGHPDATVLKESVLAELAQTHYRNGVKHFINEDLESAIAEWETALSYQPDHAKALENIENARRLLQKVETIP